jgi:hypothetical protein
MRSTSRVDDHTRRGVVLVVDVAGRPRVTVRVVQPQGVTHPHPVVDRILGELRAELVLQRVAGVGTGNQHVVEGDRADEAVVPVLGPSVPLHPHQRPRALVPVAGIAVVIADVDVVDVLA